MTDTFPKLMTNHRPRNFKKHQARYILKKSIPANYIQTAENIRQEKNLKKKPEEENKNKTKNVTYRERRIRIASDFSDTIQA